MTAPRSRRWIGFFLVLFALALTGIVVNLVYNLGLQLKPEQLAGAQLRWQENKPANYDLEYLVKSDTAPAQGQTFYVQVRSGRVVLIVEDGEIVFVAPSLASVAGPGVLALSEVQPQRYDVSALYAQIESALRGDDKSAGRNYVKADFDPKDGHPYHFVHRRGKTRVEWFVKLTRVELK